MNKKRALALATALVMGLSSMTSYAALDENYGSGTVAVDFGTVAKPEINYLEYTNALRNVDIAVTKDAYKVALMNTILAKFEANDGKELLGITDYMKFIQDYWTAEISPRMNLASTEDEGIQLLILCVARMCKTDTYNYFTKVLAEYDKYKGLLDMVVMTATDEEMKLAAQELLTVLESSKYGVEVLSYYESLDDSMLDEMCAVYGERAIQNGTYGNVAEQFGVESTGLEFEEFSPMQTPKEMLQEWKALDAIDTLLGSIQNEYSSSCSTWKNEVLNDLEGLSGTFNVESFINWCIGTNSIG